MGMQTIVKEDGCVKFTCRCGTSSTKDQPNGMSVDDVSRYRRAKTSQTRSLLCGIIKSLNRLKTKQKKKLMLRMSCSTFCNLQNIV